LATTPFIRPAVYLMPVERQAGLRGRGRVGNRHFQILVCLCECEGQMLIKTATLVAMVLTLSGCNTIAGLGDDLGLAGSAVTRVAGENNPDAIPPAAVTRVAAAPSFSHGQVITVVRPAVLRDRPSLDGNVVGYGQLGDTYVVFDQQSDWVQIGSDRPIAWIFDTLISGAQVAEPQ
jgi:predicted small secreted protein